MSRRKRRWSEARRLAHSIRLQDPLTRQQTWDTFARNYPERAAVIEDVQGRLASGALTAEACDRCDGEGKPLYDWTLMKLVGWRCYPCRKRPTDG